MDTTALVGPDYAAARIVIEGLERRGIPVDVAAWLQDDESGAWQLLISSPYAESADPRIVIQAILDILKAAGLELDNFLVAGPHDTRIRDLTRLIRTGDEIQVLRLQGLELGGRFFRSSRIYRVRGGDGPTDWLEYDARVRVKATGQLGTVRGLIDVPGGPRYLVLHDLTPEGDSAFPNGRDYAEQELEFLYAIRPGGRAEKPPLFARSA
jgi:hypothetical protein